MEGIYTVPAKSLETPHDVAYLKLNCIHQWRISYSAALQFFPLVPLNSLFCNIQVLLLKCPKHAQLDLCRDFMVAVPHSFQTLGL